MRGFEYRRYRRTHGDNFHLHHGFKATRLARGEQPTSTYRVYMGLVYNVITLGCEICMDVVVYRHSTYN